MNSFSLGDARREFFAQRSPWALVLICLAAWTARVTVWQQLTIIDAAIVLGTLVYWPFQEWWMHRWLLHLKPIKIGRFEFEAHFAKTHRQHHENPECLDGIFLPLRSILVAGLAFTGLGILLLPEPQYAFTLLGTASFATINYEWIHYLTHTRYRPKSDYYRKIWRLHRWHHYKNEHYWFSFTLPYIDAALGTGPEPSKIPRSGTARTLRPLTADELTEHT
ncbi:MAG: sterol desaturase family protein [Myxococcota bacterium]|nr:sterol desaturase family protein [Myxococcota bacterium]